MTLAAFQLRATEGGRIEYLQRTITTIATPWATTTKEEAADG